MIMRVGRIGYINCYPVYGAVDRGLVRMPGELITGTPSELNELLSVGELDLSVVSAIEYARSAQQYRLLPDLAISCDGPVRSVCLFTKEPVDRLDRRTILVSASSRTSVQLLRLLCLDRWGVAPRLVEARAEARDLGDLEGLPHEGVLVIGDAALQLTAQRRYPFRYDLGQEWKDWTGLPFVFAVWAARREADVDAGGAVHRALLESRDWGLAHLNELAEEAARDSRLPFDVCRKYLSGLDYDLSYRHIEGLTSFLRRLVSRGMVSDGALSFLAVA